MLSLPGPLVSVDWLAAHLTQPGRRAADVRSSHGVVFLDTDGEPSSPGEGRGWHPIRRLPCEGWWSHWSSDPSRPVATGGTP